MYKNMDYGHKYEHKIIKLLGKKMEKIVDT